MMCGIIGYMTVEKDDKEIELLKNLLIQSKIRGLHSCGIAYQENNKIISKIEHGFDEKILTDFISSDAKRTIIHTRYSTSGQFGQPIVVNNKAIALNGVISMKFKNDFEKDFNVECETDNDAEIMLQTHLVPSSFLKIYPNVSCAAIMLINDKLVVVRNNKRPLFTFVYGAGVFFVSTIDIARRAGYIGDIYPVKAFEEIII